MLAVLCLRQRSVLNTLHTAEESSELHDARLAVLGALVRLRLRCLRWFDVRQAQRLSGEITHR
jgi:hypothetical protein